MFVSRIHHCHAPCVRHLAHSTHVDAYVHTTIHVHIHATYAPKIDEHVEHMNVKEERKDIITLQEL